ncbi:cysteine desulfurase [Canicola haemoglobinophilus]|uniref:Probable cysteine desulfurase n=1 Tax=Canicola haemoglobinophilus TaxID=733 RepID=A0A1V4B0P5_9PAST|nr:cysteine desulfurase [Canicola haemoglobinophilus]OOS00078.1 cysteine desulfurase [Canicola haemoglobinophilus]STO60824.1 cysteine desulfurase, aminotransferase, class V [Canicola haemoglobinophilus]
MNFDPQRFRQQFPFFQKETQRVYLDSAATTLKPQVLLDATYDFYSSAGSVHRSQYDEKQTALFEQARTQVKALVNAESEQAIIWTSGTTQSINLVAYGLMDQFSPNDEIIISEAEHHANFVTWQQIAQKCGAKLIILPLQDNWLIEPHILQAVLNENTKLVALNVISNVTGTEQPITKLIPLIRKNSSAFILLDCAQAISHKKIDLQALDADFIVFSAHKIYGPTGLGVLTGKLAALEKLQPTFFGGKMVERVSKQETSFAPLPYRLESGTPNIAGVIGFSAVLNWLSQWNIAQGEKFAVQLAEQTKVQLQNYPNCRLFTSPQPSTIVSFIFTGIATSDIATLLAEQQIALRSGEHCAQPYLQRLGQSSILRLSFAPYNNQQDIEQFFNALDKTLELLA